MPALKEHMKELNFEVVAVSDLWNRRRDERPAYFKKEFATDVTLYRNNEELYEKSQVDAVIISTADFQHALHAVEAVKAGRDAYVREAVRRDDGRRPRGAGGGEGERPHRADRLAAPQRPATTTPR